MLPCHCRPRYTYVFKHCPFCAAAPQDGSQLPAGAAPNRGVAGDGTQFNDLTMFASDNLTREQVC